MEDQNKQEAKPGAVAHPENSKDPVFRQIVQTCGQNEFTGRNMRLGLDDEDSDDQPDGETAEQTEARRQSKKAYRRRGFQMKQDKPLTEVQNLYADDPSK